METRHPLQGIELRYALTLYLLEHGPTSVDELIKALEWQGSSIEGGRRSRYPMRCAGRGDAAGFVDWRAACTAPAMYRAPLNTAFTTGCWHYLPLRNRCGSAVSSCRSACRWVGWPEGVAPSGSRRSRRDNLSSPGSCHPDHQELCSHAQWAKSLGYWLVMRCQQSAALRMVRNRLYFLRIQRLR
jgi:hypothetical protein